MGVFGEHIIWSKKIFFGGISYIGIKLKLIDETLFLKFHLLEMILEQDNFILTVVFIIITQHFSHESKSGTSTWKYNKNLKQRIKDISL